MEKPFFDKIVNVLELNDKLNRLVDWTNQWFFEAYKAASSTDELDARQFVKFVSEQYPTSEAQSINLSDIATYQLRELLRQKLDADIIDAKNIWKLAQITE